MGRATIRQMNEARACRPASGGKTYKAQRIVSKQHLIHAPLGKDTWDYIEELLYQCRNHGPQLTREETFLSSDDLAFIDNGGL